MTPHDPTTTGSESAGTFDQRCQYVRQQINIAGDFIIYLMSNHNTDYASRIRRFCEEYLGTTDAPVPFGGRQQELQALNQWLIQKDGPPYALMVAEAGRGKSGLLVQWAARVNGNDLAHVAFVPISIRFGMTTESVVFEALAAQLSKIYGEPIKPGYYSGKDWRQICADYLRKAPPIEKPLLVILDGLDEANDWQMEPHLFPYTPNQKIHILLSARSLPNDEYGQKWLDQVGWQQRPGLAQLFALPPLTEAGVYEVLAAMGSPLAAFAEQDELVSQLFRLSEGDPLLVRLYVESLVSHGGQRPGFAPESLPSIQKGLNGYFERWWREQKQLWGDKNPLLETTVITILNLLACALGPLQRDELIALSHNHVQLTTWSLETAMDLLSRFVIGDGKELGYVFSHSRLRNFFYERLLTADRLKWEEIFIAYGSTTLAKLKAGSLPFEAVPSYVLQHYGGHLQRSGKTPEALYELISNRWLQAHYHWSGSYSTFLQDVDRAWIAARDSGRIRDKQAPLSHAIAMQMKCTLAYSSVASLSNRLPPSLPTALINDGLWTKPQAFAYIDHITERKQSADTRLALLQHENAHKLFSLNEIEFIVSQTLDDLILMERTASVGERSYRLLQLLPHLTTSQHLRKAVTLTKTLRHTIWRPRLLAHLAGQVGGLAEQVQLIELLIESCKQLDYSVYNDDYPHVTYIYRDIIHKVPMGSLSQVCYRLVERAREKPTPDDDKEMRLLGLFFEHLAWHISDAKAEAFVALLLSTYRSLHGVAINIARLAYRLSDQTALNIALQVHEALQQTSSPERSWVMCEVNMALLALARHRTDATIKNKLLAIAEYWIQQTDDRQYPFTREDLQTLLSFMRGHTTDADFANNVRRGQLLRNFWRSDKVLDYGSLELIPYLGYQTTKALFARVIRDDDGSGGHGSLEVGASLYIIPLIAANLPSEELSLIYRLGGSRYESFACIGYVHAAIQNYQRMLIALQNDTIAWRINSRPTDVNDELLLLIAPDLKEAHFDDDDYDWKRHLFATAASKLSINLLRRTLTGASRLGYSSELNDKETITAITRYLPAIERRPRLEKLLNDGFRITDRGEQIFDRGEQKRLLTALKRANPQKVGNNSLHPLIQTALRYLLPHSKPVTTQQETERWDQLRTTINNINQMPTREQRIAAFGEVASLLGDIIFTIGNPAYKDYAQNAQEIWSALNPRYVEDALSVIDRNHDSVQSHDYVRAFMPAVALLRQDLLPELEKHILDPYSQLKAIQYANLALFFSGEQQLALLQKSVAAFDFAEFPEYIVPRILTEIAGYADDTLIPHLLQWLARYPVATALVKLAKKVAANQEYLTQCLAIAQDIEESIHEFVTNLAPLVTVDWLRRLLLLLIERQNQEEQSRSYPALAQAWLTQLANQATYEEAYNLWYDLCSALKKYPRDYTMNQLSYFVDIVAYLGGKQATNACAAAIQDIYTWWEVEWREPGRIAQIT